MAIFGSYLDKNHTLLGESVNVIILDTFVAITAGLIIFPACFTFGVEVNAGPSLLFDTMATVFNHMAGGRLWGTLFFLFMIFAALSTELAVFENILACVREITGWNRVKGSVICGIGMLLLSLTTALGFTAFAIFCCSKRYGWGWDNFVQEANSGSGLKVKNWMRPICQYVVPIAVAVIYIYGLATFAWK